MTRATPREIAGDIEVYLRCSSHIPENDPRFTRDVNLWEEAYVDSTGVVELIVHLESRWEDPLIGAGEGRPRRRFYRLTLAGEGAVAEATDEVGEVPHRSSATVSPT